MAEYTNNLMINQVISELFDRIEETDAEGRLDLEFSNGIIYIETPENTKYVINKHGPTGQIWVSSPVSGPSHFAYLDGKFICTKTKRELWSLLKEELF